MDFIDFTDFINFMNFIDFTDFTDLHFSDLAVVNKSRSIKNEIFGLLY